MKFKKVYKHDDWGHHYYNFKKNGSGDQKLADPSIAEWKNVDVQFADGSIINTFILKHAVINEMSDMGRKYTVETYDLVIEAVCHGHLFFFPLEELKVKL
jgi:hypothetical protein